MIRRRALLRWGLFAIVIIGAFFWTSNARWRPADVLYAYMDPEQATHVDLSVADCYADLTAEARENDEAVVVLILKRNARPSQHIPDCDGPITITLKEPLGDRVLIDLSDWDDIYLSDGCDPDLGESQTLFASGSFLAWQDRSGCTMSIDLVAHTFGDPHCGLEQAEFITLRPPADDPSSHPASSNRYVWNADGVIPGLDPGRTIPLSEIPPSAIDIGYRQGDTQLWFEESAVYVVADGRARVFERHPLSLSHCG